MLTMDTLLFNFCSDFNCAISELGFLGSVLINVEPLIISTPDRVIFLVRELLEIEDLSCVGIFFDFLYLEL